MKATVILAAAIPLLAIAAGCRQRDIREKTLSVPGATNATAQAEIVAAISKIDGVDAGSAAFDGGKLVIRYDSMKLGLKNIEHAIMDAGYDVNEFSGANRK